MKVMDKISDVAYELRYNYILERTMIDAGKDIAKGAALGAGVGLALNVIGLKHYGLPKSMLKFIIK